MKINESLCFGNRLDSDGDLEIELYNTDYDVTESLWLKRKDAIRIAKHLIELFRLDVKEV